MTPDDARIADLRRIAFGRTRSAEDEARAEAAHFELEALLAPPAAERETPPAPVPVLPPEVSSEATGDAASEHGRRPAWLIPAAAALAVGILIGAGGALLAQPTAAVPVAVPTSTFAAGSSDRPPVVAPLSADHPVEGSPGDVAAALVWFEGDQSTKDKADESLMQGNDIVESSTRLVYSSDQDKIWIAQTSDGKLCMLARSHDSGALMCSTPDEFVATGIPLHVKGALSVVWNGQRMVVSTSADSQRDVRP